VEGRVPELLLEHPALGNVNQDGDAAVGPPVGSAPHAGRDLHRDVRTVLAPAKSLQALDRLARPQLHVQPGPREGPLRRQRRVEPPEDLVGPPAEHLLGHRVPQRDPTLGVELDDGHRSRVDQGLEAGQQRRAVAFRWRASVGRRAFSMAAAACRANSSNMAR